VVHSFGRNLTYVQTVFKYDLTDPNEIPNMAATSWTVILLFSRKNPFIKSAISSGLLTDGHTEHSSFLIQVTQILTLEKQ